MPSKHSSQLYSEETSMSDFVRDIQFGARLLAKSPVFTLTAVLLLAIGIGANTVIFALVDAMLLRPLPVAHPENLVRLVEQHPTGFLTWDLPYDLCDALAAKEASLSEVICEGGADVALDDGRSIERVRVFLVSPNYFSSLGVHPQLGRVLNADDERTAAQAAVLSYEFWQRRFGRSPAVLGSQIALGGRPFTIVGVSARGFNGLAVETSPDIRVPAATDRLLVAPLPDIRPGARPLFGEIFGRLRPDVSFARANAEVDPIVHASADEIDHRLYGAARDVGSALRSQYQLESVSHGVSTLRTQFSRGLDVLMAAVALLLLLACANVAGLLGARSAGRAQEICVRLALGASRARLVRQLFTEGLLLALLGGAAGMLLVRGCLPLLAAGVPPIRDRAAVLQPLALQLRVDGRVLAFILLVTLLTTVVFALVPALHSSTDLAGPLKATRASTRRGFAGKFILIAQVALCSLMLIGAALLIVTLQRLRSMNPGFDRDHIVTFSFDPRLRNYTDSQSREFSQQLLAKTSVLPGIAACAIGRPLMRGTGIKATVAPVGAVIRSSDFLNTSMNGVTPGYFETMGIHLLSGRDFNWFDRARIEEGRVIVNQTFVKHFLEGGNPIGRRFGGPGPDGIAKGDREIIGVVSDAKYRSLREPIQPTVYTPVVDGFGDPFVLHVRTRQRPEAMIPGVRAVLKSLDPAMPLLEVRTLREEAEATLWQERLLALLSSIFGAVAALLASIGLYAALDYAVKSRTREIGVRMAIGAKPSRIVAMFSGETLRVVATGFALGLGAYAIAGIWLDRVLYDVNRWNPFAIALVLVLVLLVGICATAPATYRATRVDPASALRAE
jgi:predicted permease